MRHYITQSIIFVAATILCFSCDNNQDQSDNSDSMIKPPIAKTEKYEWTLHGKTLTDNYFWMRLTDEQKNAEEKDQRTKDVISYLESENEYTNRSLAHIESLSNKLYEEITGRIKKDDNSVPYEKNGYFYYIRYSEGQEYPVYCRKKGTLESPEEVMLDVNVLAKDHAYFNVGSIHISPDNKTLAYCVDTVSRRIYTYHFKNLKTGNLLDDKIENAEPGAAWANDSKTFFYTSKDEVTLLSNKIKRHQLGQKEKEDAVVYEEDDETFYIGVYKSKSEDYVIIYNSQTITTQYHILSADNPLGTFKPFSERTRGLEYNIWHDEDQFYVLTNKEAQNFRLMTTPTDKTGVENWTEIIPHRPDVLLQDIDVFKDYLVLDEKKNGLVKLRVIGKGKAKGVDYYIPFDDAAYVAGTTNNVKFDTDILRFSYGAMNTPRSIYDFNMETKERTLMKQTEVVGGIDPSQYKVERLMVKVRDGAEVPVSIVYKKGFQKDGNSPLLLYGYGSYGYSIQPGFSISRLSLLDRGFAFAIAHIRGSETMGRQWYEDGKMLKKKNTFYDFIDVAKYFAKEKYTSPEHTYAMGGSAGGLLMGAIMNMAPKSFNGVVAQVPFVDVVNTMYDETIPLTTNEWDEWGNPKIKEQYEYINSYSPYDNVTAQEYPNTLVMTGFFDSQVQYWEPAKWVAKLRATKTGDQKLFLKTDMEAGHGGASGRLKGYKDTAFEYAFLLDLEGIKE